VQAADDTGALVAGATGAGVDDTGALVDDQPALEAVAIGFAAPSMPWLMHAFWGMPGA